VNGFGNFPMGAVLRRRASGHRTSTKDNGVQTGGLSAFIID